MMILTQRDFFCLLFQELLRVRHLTQCRRFLLSLACRSSLFLSLGLLGLYAIVRKALGLARDPLLSLTVGLNMYQRL